ncbi:TPA: hypothetical protein N2N50_000524 [Kluyvera ascorbata]|nr:hypothetical protein STW0522KLE44_21110 [Klebsiella sp. STW0522-44]HAT7514042.1 hypothetical protein [Kluyvera ascorbata]HCL5619568.1 hypothetical protein [Kluyvera ascorbata]HED3201553.1 hypothetical protein [Kluyvera ascorbata]HED4085403.1 hypothetical protein [Kluyvera ascorbata]
MKITDSFLKYMLMNNPNRSLVDYAEYLLVRYSDELPPAEIQFIKSALVKHNQAASRE